MKLDINLNLHIYNHADAAANDAFPFIKKHLTAIGTVAKELLKEMGSQKDLVKAAIADLKQAVVDEANQVNSKLAELQAKIEAGEDYSEVITEIKDSTAAIKQIVADAPTEPVEEPSPAEPAEPAEETPEEPAEDEETEPTEQPADGGTR
jgi:gas vesicle protein